MDSKLISQTTNAIYRYAKTEDVRLSKELKKFYTEGIKSPGAAKHLGYLSFAKYSAAEGNYLKDPINILTQGITAVLKATMEIITIPLKIKIVVKNDTELKTLKNSFDSEFKRLYPHTGKRRNKIMKKQMNKLGKKLLHQ